MPTVKVFVAGLSKSGKTETIKGVSDIPLVSVEKRLKGMHQEVQMEYGRVHIDNYMLYLYGPLLSSDLTLAWNQLKDEMEAMIFLISGLNSDSAVESLATLKELVKDWQRPLVVGITGIDLDGFRDDVVAVVSKTVGIDIPVVPYSSLHREGARGLVTAIAAAMTKHNKRGG